MAVSTAERRRFIEEVEQFDDSSKDESGLALWARMGRSLSKEYDSGWKRNELRKYPFWRSVTPPSYTQVPPDRLPPLVMLEEEKKALEEEKERKEREREMAREEEGEECPGLEPLFFDEAEAVAEYARQKEAERQREDAKELQRQRDKADWEAMQRIYEYDPKRGGYNFTRFHLIKELATFDLDEESPLGPMRDTEAPIHVLCETVCKECKIPSFPGNDSDKIDSSGVSEGRFVPCNSANIFSVKIVSSDVGFPMNVYGTIIARDSLDLKCVYLFKRDRHDCQLILSKDESLILTGPKRGLALIDRIYLEFDLKVKGRRKQKDRQLSKGYFGLDGCISEDEMFVKKYYLDTMLSKVVLMCAVEKNAVEATIAIEVIQGKFYGEITACTTGYRESIVLHDGKMTADSTENAKGVIPLVRRVVAVSLKEKLILTVARTGACKAKSTVKFTPSVNGGDEKKITCGFVQMRVKVTWSIISRLDID